MKKSLVVLPFLLLFLGCGDDSAIKKGNSAQNNTTPQGCVPACTEGFSCVANSCVEQMDPNECDEGEEFNEMIQVCLTPSCENGIKDMAEEGPDCGGPCAACTAAPTCTDGVQNGEETGVDCGGPCAQCTIPDGCGNGTVDTDEACDHGGSVQLACVYGEMSCMVCNAQCQLIPGQVIGFCGDGATQAAGGEDCDHGGSPETVCAYGETSCTVCNDQCRSVAGATQFCGDGIRQNNEDCDGTQLNSATCASLNAGTGTPACTANCTFDVSGCVSDTPRVTQLSVGYSHTCARMSDGTARCWGRNDDGRLGNGTTNPSPTPVTVSGLTNVAQISAGGFHTCARRTDGSVWCWGLNTDGQLGNGTSGTNRSLPVQVLGLPSAATAIETGTYHSCAITATGTYCWGWGANGRLGDGSTTSMFNPMAPVNTGANIIGQISAGVAHTCARYTSGNLVCWGRNTDRQIGSYLLFGDTSLPTNVLNSNGSNRTGTFIGAGAEFSCALAGNSIYCWGNNDYYQLGTTALTVSESPVQVSGTYSFLSVGERHACGYQNGTISCWGNNQEGRLGDGTTTDRHIPVQVAITGAQDVQAGGTHTCARLNTGGVKCWGRNSDGQLGNGTLIDSSLPVDVTF